ncbi:hypothetical protein PSCICM_21680 [Pseudomonas cichorii]|uniref:Uncharacterized protein n=1 Tax=Pseudomonas cichorii TaxID=36746 RepID=A0ABQ1DN24_PSECI|nr:hypothetical protein PSCICJ_42870 [Pseudomonas cichorii]GFM76349.1 hypothetical protein PSCICM_21680 [Pseudomonas cichorii]GFM92416.1 hypothetical protein PSCICP_23880 [Pseudomonas cichorii]
MLRIYPQPAGKIRLQRRDGAPGKSDCNKHLHQNGNTKRDENRTQQAAA